MIHIIGGFYEELCLYPQWDYNFGSGGRATAALAKFGEKICFHSYIHDKKLSVFDYFSKIYNVDTQVIRSSEMIKFEYYHSLSAPNIYTLNTPICQQKQVELTEDIVICYGMMEAPDPIVHTDYLIYDPQSENDPSMIFENGSTTNHLALILNVEEGKKYTQKDSIQDISKFFFERTENLEVLILKDGPFGAHLFSQGNHHHINLFVTDNVFKIGSGDVFVAVFGYLWAKDKLSPLEAAKKASLATAHYCNSSVLPIDKETLFGSSEIFKAIAIDRELFSKTIYLAGPFFTMAERWLVEEAKYQFEKFRVNVFSPLHDVGYGASAFVTKADLDGINNAHIVYAVLDDYDPGTIFEIGYAISRNIPVVVFIENKSPINMTLFEGSGCMIESDFATSIYKAIWEASKIS